MSINLTQIKSGVITHATLTPPASLYNISKNSEKLLPGLGLSPEELQNISITSHPEYYVSSDPVLDPEASLKYIRETPLNSRIVEYTSICEHVTSTTFCHDQECRNWIAEPYTQEGSLIFCNDRNIKLYKCIHHTATQTSQENQRVYLAKFRDYVVQLKSSETPAREISGILALGAALDLNLENRLKLERLLLQDLEQSKDEEIKRRLQLMAEGLREIPLYAIWMRDAENYAVCYDSCGQIPQSFAEREQREGRYRVQRMLEFYSEFDDIHKSAAEAYAAYKLWYKDIDKLQIEINQVTRSLVRLDLVKAKENHLEIPQQQLIKARSQLASKKQEVEMHYISVNPRPVINLDESSTELIEAAQQELDNWNTNRVRFLDQQLVDYYKLVSKAEQAVSNSQNKLGAEEKAHATHEAQKFRLETALASKHRQHHDIIRDPYVKIRYMLDSIQQILEYIDLISTITIVPGTFLPPYNKTLVSLMSQCQNISETYSKILIKLVERYADFKVTPDDDYQAWLRDQRDVEKTPLPPIEEIVIEQMIQSSAPLVETTTVEASKPNRDNLRRSGFNKRTSQKILPVSPKATFEIKSVAVQATPNRTSKPVASIIRPARGMMAPVAVRPGSKI